MEDVLFRNVSAQAKNITSYVRGVEAVDISSTDHTFTQPVLGLYISVAGVVVFECFDGSTMTETIYNDGQKLLGYIITKVKKTGTTATVTHGLIAS